MQNEISKEEDSMHYHTGKASIMGVALVNYFKIQLRADPFLAVDLSLASEAAGIVGNYELELNWLIWLVVAALVGGLIFSIVLMPQGIKGWPIRMLGAVSAAALLCVSFVATTIRARMLMCHKVTYKN